MPMLIDPLKGWTRCPNCGCMVSARAGACPNCGRPNQKPRRRWWWFVAVTIAIIAVAVVALAVIRGLA